MTTTAALRRSTQVPAQAAGRPSKAVRAASRWALRAYRAREQVADQTYPLSSAPGARYVRITTTTLPDTNTWASFFEFQVYGH
jgi:hypothetical protein